MGTYKELLEMVCSKLRYDPKDYFFIYRDEFNETSVVEINADISDQVILNNIKVE